MQSRDEQSELSSRSALADREQVERQPIDPERLRHCVETARGGDDYQPAEVHLSYRDAANRELGSVVVAVAERPAHEPWSRLPVDAIQHSAWVRDLCADSGQDAAALCYLALRRARIWGRSTVVCFSDDAALLSSPMKLEPTSASSSVSAQRIDYAADNCWLVSDPVTRQALHERFVPEAVETLERWVRHFFTTRWFETLYSGRLSRQQYIYTLSNLHQFVRWTTRLIGRAVSHSHDRALRDHWLEHLRDEINHELIIEKDLKNLGVDPAYVAERMVPEPNTLQFMGVQESLIGFHGDPVLFMAAPFVAEGYGARLDERFMGALEESALGWGIKNPRLVTSFYASHISYDGGDDGHWALIRRILERYLTDHCQLQRFLSAVRAAADATERAYTAYIADLSVFETPSASMSSTSAH